MMKNNFSLLCELLIPSKGTVNPIPLCRNLKGLKGLLKGKNYSMLYPTMGKAFFKFSGSTEAFG